MKLASILIGLLLVLASGFGGIYLGKYLYALKMTPTPTAEPTAMPTPDPTANWKTYKSSKLKNLNMSFEYPSQMRVTDEGSFLGINHSDYSDGGGIDIERFDYISLEKLINDSIRGNRGFLKKGESDPVPQTTSVGGYPAKQIILKHAAKDDNDVREIYFSKGQHFFRISVSPNCTDCELDQILSTFRFLN